uniref:Ig-like domain-containing protein n=1 Tax=Limnohabitans sp. TaxID=1907725 RepID=UPI003342034A
GDNITSTTTPEISGVTEPGAAVEVTVNGKTYTATANATTGAYSVTVPPADALPIGSYTPSIKVTDAAGNSSTVAGTAFTVNQFNVSISAVDTDSSAPVVEQFDSPTFNAGVWSTNYLNMSFFVGNTLQTNEIANGFTEPADIGKGMEIGLSNSQLSAKNRTLLVTSKIGPFTDLSFEYRDLQNINQYSGTPTATVEFLDAAGTVIDTQDFLANAAINQRRTFDWDNTDGHQATSFRIVELRNDFWTLDKMSFTPMGGSLPSGSTTTDTSHTLRGTLDTALSGSQVVEIFNGGTSLGNATVTGTNWTFNVPASTFATQTYTAQVKDGAQVLSTSNAFTLIVASTPLVLDLNGDGVQTIGISEGVQFDLLNTGTPQSVGWVDRHDGLLAIDLNGDGHINSGAELFGDHTQLSDGSLAKDGWHALAEMDSNADGQINALDVNFDRLLLWVDANSNGISDAGELSGLAAANIASIDLAANTHSVQQNGNVVQAFSTYTTLDGRTLEVADVGFQVNPAVFASHGMDAVQPLVDTAMLNASRPML